MSSRKDLNEAIYYAKLINFDRKTNQNCQNQPSYETMNIYQDISDSDFVDQVNQQHLIQLEEKQCSQKTKRLTLSEQNSKQNSINQIYRDNLNSIFCKQHIKSNNNEQLLFKLIKTNSSKSTSPCSTSSNSTSSTSSKLKKSPTSSTSSIINSQTLLIRKKPSPDLNTYLQYSLITKQIPKQAGSKDLAVSNDEESNHTIQKNFDLLVIKPSYRSNHSAAHDSTLLTPLHDTAAKQGKKISIDNISSPILVPFDSFNYYTKLNKNSTNSSPAECPQPTIKSASTSYLLSKISSLANLTLPKSRQSVTPTSSSSSSSSAQQSPIMNSTGLMNNLASKTTKFFNRKLSQQQMEMSTTPLSSNSYMILSSSSVNSIDQENPSPSITMDLDENFTNNIDDECDEEINCLMSSNTDCNDGSKMTFNKSVNRIKHLKSASSSSSSTKSSESTNVTSTRRQFKKRSQSIHANINNKVWFYNPAEECWYMTGPIDKISSASSCTSFGDGTDQTKKIKLNDIQVKFLTLIELKYLKQICFNKLQLISEQNSIKDLGLKSLSIPKDESMKTIKTKNISSTAIRSRSVDFKFFEDIKENYFFKKGQKENNELVFGQTLYKCILNDLKKNTYPDQKKNISLNVNKRWKANTTNLMIASKNDLNILNGTCKQKVNLRKNHDHDYAKRNSVLFEALDLKNSTIKKNMSKYPNDKNKTDSYNNNQNLSIRSEGLVPNIVKSCCKHISDYGLDVVGIFRIDSSKKRIKELKEMYDNGKNIDMGEHFNTNDAACLLKEYLRSLPEPLLTRDLYSSFLATNKITNRVLRLEMTRYLIFLLPVPNRDTLEVLLKLLDKVRSFSEPVSQSDKTIGGNKMDAFNLAMVFGPNLLKKYKLSQISLNTKPNELQNDKYNIIDDIDSVISVTKYLIENQNIIFNIGEALHNELVQTINKITPSEVELILNRKIASQIGVTILGPNQANSSLEQNSEFSTEFNSNNQITKQNVNEEKSSSGSFYSSNFDLDRLIQSSSVNSLEKTNINKKNLNENVDFIDNANSARIRSSRTKLHKISNNFTYHNETICFVNSPSHSPVGQSVRKPKRISEPYKYSENAYENFYSKPVPNQGSLLLMIQNQDSNQRPKIRQTDSILSDNRNDRIVMSKSIRSLSNLKLESSEQTEDYRLNSSKLCSKYYDKSKFNTIGEQETLV